MRALIAGAGVAGLSLALRLRQRGLAPIVIKRSPRLHERITCSAFRTRASSAGHYSSADLGTARSAAWKPTFGKRQPIHVG